MADVEMLNDEYEHDPNINLSDFPRDFMFGVGTSSYQIEGAWNADGKGLHIWDSFTLRHPEKIDGGSNGCVAVDSYHKMKEDVQLLKKMGVNYYRFSISWSRILPGGKVSMGKNLEGINYYNKLIDELKANDIEPFVTLFHWDLPNALEEEYMGFLSPKIVPDFVSYAEICFWEFGDRVKHWVTINEPNTFASLGYAYGVMAPGRGGKGQDGDCETEPYTVAYHLLNCHAAAYRKYQEDFQKIQKGKVGITLGVTFFKPFGEDSTKDAKTVKYAHDFTFGLFLEPISTGNWPQNVQNFATTPSVHHPQGRSLHVFTDEEKKKLIQSYDFLGLNYYTSSFAKPHDDSPGLSKGFISDGHYLPSDKDLKNNAIGTPAYEGAWVYLCALELVDLLAYIKKTYEIKSYKYIVITENGAPEQNDDKKTYEQVKNDAFRLKYIKWHLEAIRRANSVRKWTEPWVMGYFVWSFTDSFEWNSGYTMRFGMNYVDYKNNLNRYPKKSALWYKKFLSEERLRPLKSDALADVEQEDEVNGASIKAKQSVESVQKLKKAKT